MIFFFLSIGIPLILLTVFPVLLEHWTKHAAPRTISLGMAATLYGISWYLPSPLISGENTAFTTHFIGGGVFTGFLWYYLKGIFNWKSSRWIELGSLYAFVSALGVANELFEFAIFELHILNRFDGRDTWWDLVANTLGMLLFWIGFQIYLQLFPKPLKTKP